MELPDDVQYHIWKLYFSKHVVPEFHKKTQMLETIKFIGIYNYLELMGMYD